MTAQIRALLDTNVLVSYLLPSGQSRAVATIIEGAVSGAFTLLLPEEIVAEFTAAIAAKPYLASRIRPEEAALFVELLSAAAEIIPPIADEIPAITRDRKDDFLLAYALFGEADYLVTGDGDLLDLPEVAGVRVVTPARFAEIIQVNR